MTDAAGEGMTILRLPGPDQLAQATLLATTDDTSVALLSRSAYRMQTAHISRLKPGVFYGMGLFLDHGWILQNPSLNGFNAVFAYLPPRHISIAVTTTLGPRSISGHNYSTDLTRQIARYLAPGHPIS